jgi:hypothetical protein
MLLQKLMRAASEPRLRRLFYKQSLSSNASLTSHTFSNVDIGEPQASRIVVVVAAARTFVPTRFLSCTINGATANSVIGTAPSNGNTTGCRIISSLFVPSGTTANIVLTLGQTTVSGIGVHVLSMYGPSSDIAAGWEQRVAATGLSSLVTPVTTQSEDILISGGYKTNTEVVTWSNAAAINEVQFGTATFHLAADETTPASSRDVTVSWATAAGAGGITAWFR